MRCGWTEEEIGAEVERLLSECGSNSQRELIVSLAAEAKERDNSWPLKPKYVAPPPLYLEQRAKAKQ